MSDISHKLDLNIGEILRMLEKTAT